MSPNPDVNKPGGESPEKKKHVETRPLTTDEIQRAKAEGSLMIVLPDCACEVEGGVYGKLIIV
jgi:hypothetical protein